MKNIKYILLSIFILGLFQQCSKDLGTYSYNTLNEINFTDVREGNHSTKRIYDIPFKGTLEINPKVEGTLSGGDHKDLTFEWKLDNKVISTSINFSYIANEKYGKLPGEFIVTDQKTGYKKYYHFFVNVENPYKLGYYVLAKDAKNDALLYCKSTIISGSVFEKVLIPNISLGKNPLTIGGVREYGHSSTDYFNKLIIGVKNAPNPVFMIDTREFLPVIFYNNTSYVGDLTNFNFEPSEIMLDPYFPVIYVVNNGKIHVLQKGGIDLPIFRKDVKDYQAGFATLVAPNSSGHRYFSFYDTKNKTMRLLDNTNTNFSYDFTKSYDDLLPESMFENQKFIAGCQASIDQNTKMMYLMLEGQTLKSYKVNYDSKRIPTDIVKLAESVIPGDGFITSAYYDFKSNFWYLSTNRAIYRASHLGLEFQSYLELPEDFKGVIKKFKILNSRLMIGTYDPEFNGDLKGSVLVYNINNMNLIFKDENVVEEIVDMHIGN